MKTMRWTIVFAIVLAALSLASCSSSNPEATTRHYVEALAAGNADAAMGLIHLGDNVSAADMAMAEGKIKSMVLSSKARFDARGGLDSLEIGETTHRDESHAAVAYVLHFGDGTTREDSQRVTLVNGKWLVEVM